MVLTRSKAKQHVGDASGDAATNSLASGLQDRVRTMRATLEHGADPALSNYTSEDSNTLTQEFGIARSSAKRRKKSKPAKSKCRDDSNEEELMNPKLWETLPRELLQLMFTRLPVNEIRRLQILSKEWNQTVTTPSSIFFRDCDEAYPTMLCFVTQDKDDAFWVRTLDMQRNNWYTYKIPIAGKIAKSKHGVGLVCCYSEENLRKEEVNVSLVNPLTRVQQHLPALCGVRQVKRVELMDDQHGKPAVLVTVADEKTGGMKSDDEVIHLYDSVRGQWSTAQPSSHRPAGKTWQVYEFEEIEQSFIRYSFYFGGLKLEISSEIMSYIFYQGLCFVLRKRSQGADSVQSTTYYIEEFHHKVDDEDPAKKVKVKTHKCDPFEQLERMPYHMELYACEGFLMVIVPAFNHENCFEKELGWLYDLSTCIWSPLDLPQLPVCRKSATKQGDIFSKGLLLKPKWTLHADC